MFVKLGVVPVCVTVRFPLVRLIVPAFRCTALARAKVSVVAPATVSVPC